MKKMLKILACLLVAMIAILGTNVSQANAQACDKSAAPTCFETLESGESVGIPLPGFDLKKVTIEFVGGPIPAIYPPPTVNYDLEVGFTKVQGKLEPTAKAKYKFDPPAFNEGKVSNLGGLPAKVSWKNIPSED